MLSHLWACIKGPRVFRVYTPTETEMSHHYPANPFEHGSQQVIKGITILANIGLYVSPLVLMYFWRRDYTLEMACVSVAKLTAGFTLLYLASMAIRGFGRSVNPHYNTFLGVMREAEAAHKKAKLSHSFLAKKYDCDFSALPITYKMEPKDIAAQPNSIFQNYLTPGGLAAHAFGRHLIYPGSIQLLQAALGHYLEDGRTNLVTKHNGTRAKVMTADGNQIDTIFVDRRPRSTPQGSTLVLCCEGNAGFYEVGILNTPLAAGYSILGWNIPGFAYSTGLPFPSEVHNGVDAVMQFAINELGFTPDNILVYGWSIGGYPAALVAKQYPDIRGLILDATFDHVLPLALPRMPGFMAPLVQSTIMTHFDLCVSRLAAQYAGPITVIRRKEDEIITTVEGDLSTNRANNLLEDILLARYPRLFTEHSRGALAKFMRAATNQEKAALLSSYNVNSEDALAVLTSHLAAEGAGVLSFPSSLGQDSTISENTSVLLFLATKLLLDVDGDHPAPLSESHFKQPWSLVADDSFVQVE